MQTSQAIEAYLQAVPKAELHVHLEGSIRPETLLTLAQRNGVELPVTNVEELRQWFAYRDFNHFVEIFFAVSRCLKTSPTGLRRRLGLVCIVHHMRVRRWVPPVCGAHYVHWEQNELVTVYALLKIKTWWPTWQRNISPWKSVRAAIFAWVFIPA